MKTKLAIWIVLSLMLCSCGAADRFETISSESMGIITDIQIVPGFVSDRNAQYEKYIITLDNDTKIIISADPSQKPFCSTMENLMTGMELHDYVFCFRAVRKGEN